MKKKVDEAAKAAAAAGDATKTADSHLAGVVRGHEGAEQALRIATERLDHAKRDKAAAEATKRDADQQLTKATAAAAGSVRPLRGLAFSADGKVLATGGDQANVQLWEVKTVRPLQSEVGTSSIGRLVFVGNSNVLSAADDRSLTLWETNPAWKFVGRIGPQADAPLETGSSSLVGRVLCLAFNPAGTLLATGGGEPSRSGELKLWNIPAFTLDREIKDAHSDTVFGVEFSRDGKYLASGAADKFLKVFDVASGKFVRSFEGHTNHVLGVSWKADGSLLASAGADNQIKIWNFETGEQTRSITHLRQAGDLDSFHRHRGRDGQCRWRQDGPLPSGDRRRQLPHVRGRHRLHVLRGRRSRRVPCRRRRRGRCAPRVERQERPVADDLPAAPRRTAIRFKRAPASASGSAAEPSQSKSAKSSRKVRPCRSSSSIVCFTSWNRFR